MKKILILIVIIFITTYFFSRILEKDFQGQVLYEYSIEDKENEIIDDAENKNDEININIFKENLNLIDLYNNSNYYFVEAFDNIEKAINSSENTLKSYFYFLKSYLNMTYLIEKFPESELSKLIKNDFKFYGFNFKILEEEIIPYYEKELFGKNFEFNIFLSKLEQEYFNLIDSLSDYEKLIAYLKISENFYKSGNFEKSIIFLEQCFNLIKENSLNQNFLFILNDIIIDQVEKELYEEALLMNDFFYDLTINTSKSWFKYWSIKEISNNYINLNEFQKALQTINHIEEQYDKTFMLTKLAIHAYEKNDKANASHLLYRAYFNSFEIENIIKQIEALLFISKTYHKFDNIFRPQEILNEILDLFEMLEINSEKFKASIMIAEYYEHFNEEEFHYYNSQAYEYIFKIRDNLQKDISLKEYSLFNYKHENIEKIISTIELINNEDIKQNVFYKIFISYIEKELWDEAVKSFQEINSPYYLSKSYNILAIKYLENNDIINFEKMINLSFYNLNLIKNDNEKIEVALENSALFEGTEESYNLRYILNNKEEINKTNDKYVQFLFVNELLDNYTLVKDKINFLSTFFVALNIIDSIEDKVKKNEAYRILLETASQLFLIEKLFSKII